MAQQQNSGTGNSGNFGSQSTTGSTGTTAGAGGGGGASTQAAKDNTSITTGGAGSGSESNSESNAGTLGNVTNKVKGLYQTAADSQVGQAAKDALGQVKENATSAIDDKKANIAQGLTSVADTLRQVGDSVKPPVGEQPNKVAELTTQYTETLSQQVEKLSGYLERQDLSGLMTDLERFARRNPVVFLGGAFALGILASRFLKSSNPNQALMRTSDVSDFDTTPSNLGGVSTRKSSSLGKTSENPYGGVTIGKIGDIGDKRDSFGETSGSLGSDKDTVKDLNTGSGSSSRSGSGGSTSGTATSSTSPGATDSAGDATSSSSPKPSNKTGGDFGKSGF